MADEKVKFSEEELEKIKDIQKKYIEIQTDLGQIAIARLRLTGQLDSLDTEETNLLGAFKDTQINEQGFVDGIREKYGDGTLDPKTGEYTKNSPK
tara:strand:- start:154 stop:438 length:285 start_codon:yes stop_codon:yes gene_type:complete